MAVDSPPPVGLRDRVAFAHGEGGHTRQCLIDAVFRPAFANRALDAAHDGATLSVDDATVAFTTDSFVARPVFFPGGTIGDLAVNGTVNDLAMCGARPRWVSAAFILEEGLPVGDLQDIVASMRNAAAAADVEIVTGDTKIVERGKGDGVFITTSGLGVIERGCITPSRVRAGDAVIVSGDLGRHGVAMLAARKDLSLEARVCSDTASVWPAVRALLDARLDVHCLRDLTRGLAPALSDIAIAARVSVSIDEPALTCTPQVRCACDRLGLDPWEIPSEGRFVAIVAAADAPAAMCVLRQQDVSRGAVLAGQVSASYPGEVRLRRRIGRSSVLDPWTGRQLQRMS
jgi:hydrogenase expression/formation protein HypE